MGNGVHSAYGLNGAFFDVRRKKQQIGNLQSELPTKLLIFGIYSY